MTNDILCALDGGDGSCLDPSRSVFCLWCYRTPCLFIGLQESQSSRPATVSLVSHKISFRSPILFILYSAPLFSLITIHSLSNQSSRDDTLLLQSSFPDHMPLSWLYRHAIVHLWGEDLNDLKQTETERRDWEWDTPSECNRTLFFFFFSWRSTVFCSCWHFRHSFTTCARHVNFIIWDNTTLDKNMYFKCSMQIHSLKNCV